MADVNSNININFDTAAALAQLRSLQAGLSKFHQSLAEGNLAASNAQKGLNAQLIQSIGATGKFSASQVKVAGSTLAFTSALEKNKLSLREYYRYTMAAATANTNVLNKAFAQEREIINRARRDRVKALQAQYIQMNKSNAGFMDSIRVMPKSLQMAGGKFTELGTRIQYAAQRQQFLNQLLKQGSTQLLNFGKNTQWAGRQLMVGLSMPLALLGGAAAKAFKELEAETVKFRRVYGDAFTNDAEVAAAVANIRKLGTEYTKYGIAVTKTMDMAATAAAAGFTGDALSSQVQSATKLAVLGQIDQQQALQTTISLQSAFGISSADLAKKINFLNAVENQTLLSIEDLTIAIPKAAPVVKQLGGSVEDLAFFLTAMKEGGINASEGANALKSGLASLINPSAKASDFLGKLGINITGLVEANKGDIKGIVVGFARALDTLDPLNRAKAIEQMFGKFQFARLSTLFQNVTKSGSQASRAFDLAGASVEELAIISEREMKKVEEATGVKFQAALENLKQEIMPLGKAFLEALTPVVKFFGGLLEKFNGLGDNTKKVIAIIVAAVAGLGPVLLMTFGLLMNGVANVIKFFAMLRGGIAKLNGQTNVMGAGFNYMTQEQIENAASSQQLHQTHTRLIEVFNVEKASVSALASSYNSLSTQMRSMASQNPGLFAGGMGGAKRAVSKLPPTRKYKDGVISVPGPKGAGDVVPAMLSPGEAVIPTATTDKYRGLISAMFQDKVPGFMAGRLPGGPGRGIPLSSGPEAFRTAQQAKYRRINDARQGYSPTHPENKSGPVFVGMPKSAEKTSQSRQIVDKISQQVSLGRFGTLPPSNFGTLLQPFSGRSFPVPGVGGIYRKPNGKIVVVKPTMDEKTALAEVRATEIAREVHGLVAPKQSIRTMIDPTDPAGQRKFIVVESPYDPRIASMDGKFKKSDMVKQLVASTLRGDKDLQRPNLSGKVLADVGTAGVFDRASGFRDFAKAMPSMEQQAIVNLLGVKGGAKKFFAQETSSIAAGMTPKQYDDAIKTEIQASIPRLEKLVKSWDLNPEEQVVYGNMLKRLKAGGKVHWDKLQPMHARASDGVVKAIDGIGDTASKSLVEKQLAKYIVPEGAQAGSLVEELKRNAQSEFANSLGKLDPQRRAIVEAAWSGGKAIVPPSGKEQKFNTPRQTAFMNELSKMVPVKVGDEIKYVHKDDYNAFKTDPEGRAKYARSSQQVIDNMLYRMGTTKRGEKFVAGGKFTGRFAAPDHFKTDLRSTGKESGGFLSNVKKEFRKPLRLAQNEYNANIANDPRLIKMMTDAGLTTAEARSELKAELSHIKKTGEGGRGDAKWLKGTGLFDSKIVNRYMNSSQRLSQQLEWNKANGYPLIPKTEVSKYYEASAFMKTGRHPANSREASLLALAIDADKKALANTSIPFKTDQSLAKLNALGSLVQERVSGRSTGFYDKANKYNLGAGNTKGLVLAKLGEYIYDKPKKTLEKITRGNSKTPPSNVKADTGKQSDNRLVSEGANKSVVTKAQAARIARGRGVMLLPGRDAGNPGLQNPTVKQGQLAVSLRAKGFSQSEIDRTLRRFAEREINAKKATAIAAEKAARVEAGRQKEQAAIQKRQTDAARKAFVESQRRAELNRQQALHYDAAVKEDQQRTLKAQKQTQKATTKQNRIATAEKVGRVSGGASMALGTAGMGLMMAGQQTAGMAAMGASAVAGMAPMFAGMGPFGIAVTALAATGGGLYLLNKASKAAAESQSKLVDQTFATTEKMKGIGQLTGKVGASEIYDRKRQGLASDRYTTGFDRGKQQFGATFLQNEVGKDVMAGFTKQLASGTDTAAKTMAIQLAGYVSDGIMTAEQAHSVASQIGIDLNNTTLTSQISGQLLDLIGPSGQDLLTNPLEVRVKLVQEQRNISTQASDMFKKEVKTPTDTGFHWTMNDRAQTMAADVAAMGVQNLEFNRAQQDSLNAQYDKELKILETKKAATTDAAKAKIIDDEILALSDKRQSGLATLRKTNNDILKDQLAAFKVAQQKSDVEKSFFDSLKSQVKTKAEATGQGAFADTFLKSSADLKSKQLEVKINTIVASGTMPTATATTLLDIFAGKETELNKFLNVTTKLQDPGKVTQLINSLGGLKGAAKPIVKTIMAKIATGNPEEADKLVSTIALMEKMSGKEINMQAFFSAPDAMKNLEDLQKQLEAVEKLEGPITPHVIETIDVDGNSKTKDMGGLLAVWDQWGNLPDEVKKTVVQEYITVLKTITEGDINAYTAEKVKAAGGAGTVADYWNSPAGQKAAAENIAAERTMQSTKQDQASAKAAAKANSSSGAKKEDPYKFLLDRLKNVRNAAINAAGGIAELNKALAAGNSKSVQDKFRGVEQQMNAKKLNRQFIDFAMGQDPKEQAKYFTTAGSKIKTGKNKGRIVDPYDKTKLLAKSAKEGDVVLSKLGETYNKAFDAAVVGEFNSSVGKSLALLNEQETVRRKLVAAGYDSASIENILSDEYTTSAIASDKITQAELNTNAELSKQLTNRQKINNLISIGSKAIEEQSNMKKIPDVIKFLGSQGLSKNSIKDIIGDPGSLSDAIGAMEDYSTAAGKASGNLEEIVKGLKAIQDNSNIKIAIEFATKNLSQQAQAGADAANKVMDAKRTAYSYMTASELSNATAANKVKGGPAQQVGKTATATVAARYAASGTAIPDIPAGATLNSIGKARVSVGQKISLASGTLQGIQSQKSSVEDQIANSEKTLQTTLDNINKTYDTTIEGIQNTINGYENTIKGYEKDIKTKENKIKKDFTDKIDSFNNENQMMSNDLAIMDHAAESINAKYDKQVEALQQVNDLNQQIIESQTQQLDLADALSQGDISAAAKVAQQMRATQASNQGNAIMQGLDSARANELNSLTGAQTGLTKDQISERQFAISQEVYKLETDPARLAIQKEIDDLKQQVLDKQELIIAEQDKIDAQEVLRTAELKFQTSEHDKAVVALNAELVNLTAQETSQAAILKTLEDEDTKLASQETYIKSIADEAIAIDESTGMTLDKWQETIDKLIDLDDLAKSYAISLAAAETSAAAQAASWSSILESINALPSSVTTEQIINEIRNITENITRYITTVDDGSSSSSSNSNAAAKAAADKAAADKAAADALAKKKADEAAAAKTDPNSNSQDDIIARNAAAAARAAADKAAADAASVAAGHKGTKAQGLAIYPWISSLGSAGDAVLKDYGYWANGGLIPRGTDTVPAMLTPGEFVMSKYAVQSHGADKLNAINNGSSVGDSVYNYSINVNVTSDSNPDEIARAVMTQIKSIDSQKMRGVRI